MSKKVSSSATDGAKQVTILDLQLPNDQIKDSGGNVVLSFNGTGDVVKVGAVSPADQNVLTWSLGDNRWVPKAPPAGGAGAFSGSAPRNYVVAGVDVLGNKLSSARIYDSGVGAVSVLGPFDASDATILYSTLNVAATVTLSGSVGITGVTTLSNTLSALSNATFSGGIACYSTVTIKGAVTLSNESVSDQTGVTLSFGGGGVSKIGNVAPADQNVLTWSLGDGKWVPKAPAGGFSGTAPQNYITRGVDAVGNKLSNARIYDSGAGAVSVAGPFNVSDAIILYSTVNVGGLATFSGATVMSSTLGVAGATTLSNTVNIGGSTTISNALSVSNTTALYSAVNVGGALTVSNALGVSNAATLYSTLNVGGQATFSGATLMSSTLGVTGATTLSNTVNIGGGTTISNALSVSNATTLYSTLNVGGQATFSGATVYSSSVGITGVVTLSNTLTALSSATIKGSLTVSNENVSDQTGIVLSFGGGKLTKVGSIAPGGGNVLTWSAGDNAWEPKAIAGIGVFSGNVAQNYVAVGADADGTLLSNTVIYQAAGPLMSVAGGLDISNATILYSTVNVGGVGTFSGAVVMSSTLGVTGATTLSNTVNIGGGTTISNALGVYSNFTLSGIATLYSTLNVGGAGFFSGALTTSNTVQCGSNFWAFSTMNVAGAATFSGTAVFSSTVGIKGVTTLSNTLAVTSNLYATGTFSVGGAATISNSLSVSNAATLYSTVAVGGIATISNALNVYSNMTLSGTATLYSSVNIGGTGTFSGAVVMSSTLGVKGATTISNTTAVTSNLYATGTFSVGGASTFSGAVLMSTTLGVTGITTLSNTLAVTSNLYATGTFSVGGGATFSGTAAFATSTSFSSNIDLATGKNITVGGATPYRSKWFDARNAVPVGPYSAVGPNQVFGPGVTSMAFWGMLFSDNECCEWAWAAPSNWDAGTVVPIIYHYCTTNSASPIWRVKGVCISRGATLNPTWGTAQSVTDTVANSTYLYVVSTGAVTIGGTPAAGGGVFLNVSFSNWAGLTHALIGMRLLYKLTQYTE
jgi:fibronectin-binding autotransporter adhesin